MAVTQGDITGEAGERFTKHSSAKLAPEEIATMLKTLGHIHFLPNQGNLGDCLIAEGTRDFFTRYSIDYEELTSVPPSTPCKVVYGGGGIFVPLWLKDLDTSLILGPQVEKCIFLPCSMHGVDDFVLSLDERHTVLCRDRQTYGYVRALNPKAACYMGDDMSLYLDVPAFLRGDEGPEGTGPGAEEQTYAKCRLDRGLAEELAVTVRHATAVSDQGRKITFILCSDKENTPAGLVAPFCTDISAVYISRCYSHRYNKTILKAMARALEPADVVVSDRLHVCVMSMLIGKEVHMLDNNYGKLRGVYEMTLNGRTNIHYNGTRPLPRICNPLGVACTPPHVACSVGCMRSVKSCAARPATANTDYTSLWGGKTRISLLTIQHRVPQLVLLLVHITDK